MEKSFENVVPPKRTEQVSWAKIDKGTVPGAVPTTTTRKRGRLHDSGQEFSTALGEEAKAARNRIEPKPLLGVLLIAFSLVMFSQAQVPTASHVVIVLEENSNYSNVVGSSSMPYLNSLINRYGLAAQYYANTHPSIGNYFMLTTGQILTNDDSRTPSSFSVSVDNVVRELLTAGKTWKDYR